MPLDPARFAPDHDWDVVIVGGGPAGLACALTLGRAGRRVALFDDARARNAPAPHAQGLLSRDGIPPLELRGLGREECLGYGVHIRETRVEAAEPLATGGYRVKVGDAWTTARMLVLATGVRDVLPEIDGIEACWGVSAIHCPYCHGHELRERATAVLGASASSASLAVLLLGWTDDLTLVTGGVEVAPDDRELLAARGVAIDDGVPERLDHDGGEVSAVVMVDGRRLDVGAVYLQPPQLPRSPLAERLGLAIEDGAACIVADDDGRVGLPGLFLIGDASSGTQNLSHAIDEGTRAAMAANHELICPPPASAI